MGRNLKRFLSKWAWNINWTALLVKPICTNQVAEIKGTTF